MSILTSVFDHFAPLYARLTDNQLWRDSVREMARHLPPSGSTLRLIDVGGGPANSARQLLSLRPDLHIAALDISPGMLHTARKSLRRLPSGGIDLFQADGLYLPFATNSIDAITAHSIYYLVGDKPAFLAEMWRVLRPGGRLIMLDPAQIPYPLSVIGSAPRSALSVLLWHAASYAYSRLTPEGTARELDAAGFARVLGEKVVSSYGVLSRGEKTVQIDAALTLQPPLPHGEGVKASPIRGDQFTALRAPYVFLLIRQTPNQASWTLPPGAVITWEAVSVIDQRSGESLALAFTSLPKAVAFMQPAVKAGQIMGVTRIAKFTKAAAAHWPFEVLLNPTLAELLAAEHFSLPGKWLPVDPQRAVTGDE